MQKRRPFLVLVILAVAGVVGLIVAGAFREREPEYGGKRLSEWVLICDDISSLSRDMDMRLVEVARGIRGIGTNAIPYLLQWIGYEAPAWRMKCYPIVEKVLRKPAHWAYDHDRKPRLARGSVLALSVLGPEAKAAIPGLSRLMNDPHRTRSALAAARTLTHLGADALPALVSGLTNGSFLVRERVLPAFVASGTNVELVLNILIHDGSCDVRAAATNALRAIKPLALESAGK